MRRLICSRKVRFGQNGIEDFKSHPFFSNIDWDNLQAAEPPYVPEVVDDADTSNFDVEDEEYSIRVCVTCLFSSPCCCFFLPRLFSPFLSPHHCFSHGHSSLLLYYILLFPFFTAPSFPSHLLGFHALNGFEVFSLWIIDFHLIKDSHFASQNFCKGIHSETIIQPHRNTHCEWISISNAQLSSSQWR